MSASTIKAKLDRPIILEPVVKKSMRLPFLQGLSGCVLATTIERPKMSRGKTDQRELMELLRYSPFDLILIRHKQ